MNNSSVTPIKGGHAIYLEFVIIAQILAVANPPLDLDLDTHQYQENEVLIFTPLYNTENGLYRGLKKSWEILFQEATLMRAFSVMDMTRKNQKFFIAQ